MKTDRHGVPFPSSATLELRVGQIKAHQEELGHERADVERERYRTRVMDLRAQVMELSAHPLASNSDRLLLKSLQSTLGRLGNDYPLTRHGQSRLQRVRRSDACARRCERGCPND